MPRRSLKTFVLALMLIASTAATGGAARAAGCTGAVADGGEWPSYGHDLSNTRMQDQEDEISAANVADLQPAWTYSIASSGATGTFQSTPVIAGGCMYVTTNTGWVIALDAGDGALQWQHNVGDVGSFLGGLFAPSVSGGRVYVNVSTPGAPHVVAFDASTGEPVWRSEAIVEPEAFTNASAVVFEDLVFMGVSGAEGGNSRPGGFAIFDATRSLEEGNLLKRTYTVPQADYELGYAGGSIWGTAVIDPATRYAYVGTGQPSTGKKEHQHINALVKIDLDRSRATFGEIVDAYKGTPDTYIAGLANQPACQNSPDFLGDSTNMAQAGCFQLDVDFGASPNLFTDTRGNKVVGALQKAGIYHAAYASTMQDAWASIVSPQIFPAALSNASSSAHDGRSVFVVGSYPGQMFSLQEDTGAYNWVTPIADGFQYNPVSLANGIAYTTDTRGILDAIDIATGLPLLVRPMSLDTGGDVCVNLAGGAAIAHHTVYATCDTGVTGAGWVIAYRPSAGPLG